MAPKHDDERRILEDTALLPEDDPRRLAFVRSLDLATDQQRNAWIALLAENEELRLRLRAGDVPAGLSERVRSIREGDRPGRRRLSGFKIASFAAAVALTASLLASILVHLSGPSPSKAAIHELATLAAHDHASRPELTIKTASLKTLAQGLGDEAPFDLHVAPPLSGAVLVGGRVCSFGDRPLLYTCWHVGGDDVAVYQVGAEGFGLPSHSSPTLVTLTGGSKDSIANQVKVWADDGFAYAMVRSDNSTSLPTSKRAESTNENH